jgi:hypothetical protein
MDNLDAVPGTPAEFVPLLEAAEAADLCVTPFPPKSFLWTMPPDGWSWGTDSWHMTLRPVLIENDGVAWWIEYSDDDGRHAILGTNRALSVIAGNSVDKP